MNELNRSLQVLQQDGAWKRWAIRFTSRTHAAALVQPTTTTLQPTTRHSPSLQREPTLHQPTRLEAATATTFQSTALDTTPPPPPLASGHPLPAMTSASLLHNIWEHQAPTHYPQGFHDQLQGWPWPYMLQPTTHYTSHTLPVPPVVPSWSFPPNAPHHHHGDTHSPLPPTPLHNLGPLSPTPARPNAPTTDTPGLEQVPSSPTLPLTPTASITPHQTEGPDRQHLLRKSD